MTYHDRGPQEKIIVQATHIGYPKYNLQTNLFNSTKFQFKGKNYFNVGIFFELKGTVATCEAD